MKFVKLMCFAFGFLIAGAQAQANWACSDYCSTSFGDSCNNVNQFVSAVGNTYQEARDGMRSQCNQVASNNHCDMGSVTEVGCHEVFQNYDIVFRNNCNSHGTIWTSIYFLGTDGAWKLEGFWALAPGATAFVARTQNRTFYFQAHSAPKDYFWYGDGLHSYVLQGETDKYGEYTIASGTNYGKIDFPFNCN